jgi:hypothetical protein
MSEPKLRKVREEDAPERAPVGLVDGGHVYLACADCQALLVDVFITNPQAIDPSTGEPFAWRLKALCPFCGEQSYVAEVRGTFYRGGIEIPKPDDPTDGTPVTTVDPPYAEGDCFIFPVHKASPDVQPVTR